MLGDRRLGSPRRCRSRGRSRRSSRTRRSGRGSCRSLAEFAVLGAARAAVGADRRGGLVARRVLRALWRDARARRGGAVRGRRSCARFKRGSAPAAPRRRIEMARLERILAFLDARNNEVWRFFIGPPLLWDIHCVVALERWRLRVGKHVRAWLEAIGDIEALGEPRGADFEQPDHVFPEIAAEPRFDATALGHPLIAPASASTTTSRSRGRGRALVITGLEHERQEHAAPGDRSERRACARGRARVRASARPRPGARRREHAGPRLARRGGVALLRRGSQAQGGHRARRDSHASRRRFSCWTRSFTAPTRASD